MAAEKRLLMVKYLEYPNWINTSEKSRTGKGKQTKNYFFFFINLVFKSIH